MAIIKIRNAAIDLDAAEIPNLDASKITTGNFDASRIGSGTFDASIIGSGTFADARISASSVSQHATSFNDNPLNTKLALLGFKVATQSSLSKFELLDQTIDEFTDTSGIDTGNSTATFAAGKAQGVSYGTTQTEVAYNESGSTAIGNMTVNGSVSVAFDNSWWFPGGNANCAYGSTTSLRNIYIGKSWSSPKSIVAFRWYGSSDDGFQSNGNQVSGCVLILWGNSTNDFSTATQIGAVTIGNSRANNDYVTSSTFSDSAYTYHWVEMTVPTYNAAGFCSELKFYEHEIISNDYTIQSNSTTASSTPTSANLIMLMENAVGTATLNTDIKGYVSRDGGTTFTQGTLAEEGDYTGGQKIISFQDLDISSQPSGTSMKYKITTHNQSSSKNTKVSAVSLGWK